MNLVTCSRIKNLRQGTEWVGGEEEENRYGGGFGFCLRLTKEKG